MTLLPAVEESWARIDTWLARHAPLSHARLRPPASEADIAAAERTLQVTFPPDLVASLRCHDGVELEEGTPQLAYYGPLSKVADIVKSTQFQRDVGEGLADAEDEGDEENPEAELGVFWRREWLLITLGIGWQSSDGLFVSCRRGPNFGRVGRYFDEDVPSFTPWSSLRHALADFADALEGGHKFNFRVPLAVDGVLLWEDERSVIPDPVSPLVLAAATTEPVPAPPDAAEPPVTPTGLTGPAASAQGDGSRILVFARVTRPRPEPLPDQPDVVFVEGVTPAELLHRLGAIPDTVRPRGRRWAQDAAASTWAGHRPMVRVGTVGDWSYATQEDEQVGAAQFARPEVLRLLSAGSRAVALTRRGPEVCLSVTEDGVVRPEAVQRVMSPREGNVQSPGGHLARRQGVDLWPGSTATYARLLADLAEDFGIVYRPEQDAAEALSSALLLPVLNDFPEYERRPEPEVRGFNLAGVLERARPQRLRGAVAAQLARLAAETGIDSYEEVANALEDIRRGEAVRLDLGDPLDVRIRTLAAERWSARQLARPSWRGDQEPVGQEDLSAWVAREGAAQALRAFVRLPVPVAASKILHQRLSVHWRAEFAADLADLEAT
ncbi:SMI1/KNR4 family protein [Streptomyces tailanensis]|uniref:SMI1/KNR4 family protein n=1 Tax=Streptomyces tailanensis TaxID=2569858 RepID=UPI00122DD11F|nr:SMI1/KNR4 family protein [Streptomyces tailanensis]